VPASNLTIKTINRKEDSPVDAPHPNVLHHSALIFDPSSSLEEEDEYSLSVPDKEANLMRWHYCLGHVTFTNR
jgi:hypothetical protein